MCVFNLKINVIKIATDDFVSSIMQLDQSRFYRHRNSQIYHNEDLKFKIGNLQLYGFFTPHPFRRSVIMEAYESEDDSSKSLRLTKDALYGILFFRYFLTRKEFFFL